MEGALVTEAPLVDVMEVARAGGGIIHRRRGDGVSEIVLVHRPAYDDWSLPKGKLHPGEREEEAALREVEEETGLRCRLGREIGVTCYRDARGRTKTVRYWMMTPEGGALAAANEIDEARWVSLEDARGLLTYERDLELIETLGERP